MGSVKYTQRDIIEMHGVFGVLRDGILDYHPDIDIAARDKRRKVVVFRSLVFYHMHEHWLKGISYNLMGKELGYMHDSIRYTVRKVRDIMDNVEYYPMWKDVYDANDIVETIYNNYIKK